MLRHATGVAWRTAWLLGGACGFAFHAQAIERYLGRAYAMGDGHLLYTEEHWSGVGDDRATVLYRCPDGHAFARKHIDVVAEPQSPDFELVDGRDGYRQGVRGVPGQRTVFYQPRRDSAERAAALPEPADAVIDAGFDAWVRGHWDALARGSAIAFPFLLPTRLGYGNFRIRSTGTESIDARPALGIRLAFAAWYGFALPHIDVAYDVATRRLRRYVGLVDLRDDRGDNIRARIEFAPRDRHGGAPASALAAAESAPLDGRCTLR
jgi:hypothetical protein